MLMVFTTRNEHSTRAYLLTCAPMGWVVLKFGPSVRPRIQTPIFHNMFIGRFTRKVSRLSMASSFLPTIRNSLLAIADLPNLKRASFQQRAKVMAFNGAQSNYALNAREGKSRR